MKAAAIILTILATANAQPGITYPGSAPGGRVECVECVDTVYDTSVEDTSVEETVTPAMRGATVKHHKIPSAASSSLLKADGSDKATVIDEAKQQAAMTDMTDRPWIGSHGDCGAESALHVSMLQEDNVPGAGIAGIKTFKPFQTILKDGFRQVDCVKDQMYSDGDKFGDNKYDYKASSKVSIVHYDAHVAKEDREEMTQKVCFKFCRTVPNMGFFGLTNGRHCYCAPYYKAMASDSSQCDATCPGDSTLMCGGKSKSSIFTMHMCASTKSK